MITMEGIHGDDEDKKDDLGLVWADQTDKPLGKTRQMRLGMMRPMHSGSDLLGSSEKAFSSVMFNKDCPGTHIHDQKDF